MAAGVYGPWGTFSLEKLPSPPACWGETEGPGAKALLSVGRLVKALLEVVLTSSRLG